MDARHKAGHDGVTWRCETPSLLLFGLLAALAYPIGDIVGGLAWRGYSHASQGVSELMAIGTQPRPAVLAIATTKVVIPAKAGIHCR